MADFLSRSLRQARTSPVKEVICLIVAVVCLMVVLIVDVIKGGE